MVDEGGSKETDICPLTISTPLPLQLSSPTPHNCHPTLEESHDVSLQSSELTQTTYYEDHLEIDNPNTTRTLEYTKDKYNAKIIK
jgi:hypothetical protein